MYICWHISRSRWGTKWSHRWHNTSAGRRLGLPIPYVRISTFSNGYCQGSREYRRSWGCHSEDGTLLAWFKRLVSQAWIVRIYFICGLQRGRQLPTQCPRSCEAEIINHLFQSIFGNAILPLDLWCGLLWHAAGRQLPTQCLRFCEAEFINHLFQSVFGNAILQVDLWCGILWHAARKPIAHSMAALVL